MVSKRLPSPKRVELSDGKTFLAKYEKARGGRQGGRVMQKFEEKSQKPLGQVCNRLRFSLNQTWGKS